MLNANQGINTATGTIDPCSTNHCLDCKANYQNCIQVGCDTGAGFYLHGATCKTIVMLGANEGINEPAGTIVPCSTSNCLNCKANYQICDSCNTFLNFYLQGVICKNQAMLGPNEGINSAAGKIEPCTTSNCLDCKATHRTCLLCDTNSGYYLHGAICKHFAALGANQGINRAAGTVVACSSNCMDCKADYTICKLCDTGSGYYLNTGFCQKLEAIEIGYGLNQEANWIEPCKDSNCRQCTRIV